MVDRCAQLAIRARGFEMFGLRGHRSKVPVSHRGLFLSCWTRVHAASAAIEADAADGAEFVIHSLVVHVVDDVHVHVGHIAVIEEVIVIPVAAVIAVAEIAETIINSAVETDDWTPIACVEEIAIRAPSPVAGSPEQARLRREDPSARNPIVVGNIGIPGPIAGRPNVIIAGADRLSIDGELWGSEVDENSDSDVCRRRSRR